MEARLTVLVGNIASGKSAATKLIRERFPKRLPVLVASHDDIVSMVHSGRYTAFKPELKSLYKSMMYSIITEGIKTGHHVIVDNCNSTVMKRADLVGAARGANPKTYCETIEFRIEDPAIHAHRRAVSDDRGHSFQKWLSVAREINDRFEPVGPDEGFDTRNNYYHDTQRIIPCDSPVF